MNPLTKHVQAAISETDNTDVASKYLDAVRTNLRECVATFDRRIGLLLVTVVTCELISHAAVSEFSFAGLKVSNLTLIQKLLPILIAYISYSVAAVISYRRLLEEVHARLVEKLLPHFYAHDLELYEHPPTLFKTEQIIARELKGRFATVLEAITMPLMIVIIIGPTTYLAYAHFRLFQQFGVKEPLAWISSVISLLLLSASWMQFVGTHRLSKSSQ